MFIFIPHIHIHTPLTPFICHICPSCTCHPNQHTFSKQLLLHYDSIVTCFEKNEWLIKGFQSILMQHKKNKSIVTQEPIQIKFWLSHKNQPKQYVAIKCF